MTNDIKYLAVSSHVNGSGPGNAVSLFLLLICLSTALAIQAIYENAHLSLFGPLAVYSFMVPICGNFLCFHKKFFVQNTDPNDDSLTQHSRAFYWLLLSGVFMGAQVPERFAPGLFDIYGYGHQVFF